MYVNGNTLNISVVNMKDFEQLIATAKKQAHDLQDTIHKLESFDLKVEFGTDD